MENKYKTGLVIGKFCPFHKGHQYLLETALGQCEKVTVIVCHNRKYQIDPDTRAAWIRELYPQTNVIIYNHSDKMDSTKTDISSLWAKATVKLLGFAPDAVFTSEKYGATYAQCMGSTHVLVDLKREKLHISGTKIRSNPYKYWDFLCEPVRAYYTKRIVCLGAESTGTTTLANALAVHYSTAWVPEYGRTYFEGKVTAKGEEKWTTNEFFHIAATQNGLEEALARKSNKLLICDTDAFATRLWHDRYVGYFSDELDSLVNTENKSLYILTGDEIPFVQDGFRDGKHIRHQMHQKFISELEKHHLKYIIVTGEPNKRLKVAVHEIDKLFKNQQSTKKPTPSLILDHIEFFA